MNCLPRPARNYAAAALASLALAPSSHALAAIQDATNKALTFEDEQEVCTVNRDGTYSDIFEITIRVNAQRGLAERFAAHTSGDRSIGIYVVAHQPLSGILLLSR